MKKIILLMIMLSVPNVFAAQMGITDSTGSVDAWEWVSLTSSYCYALDKFTAPGSGDIDSISFLLRGSAGGGYDSVSFAIYKRSDSTLVCSTATIQVSGSTPAWYHAPVSSGSITSSALYMVGIKSFKDTVYTANEELGGTYVIWNNNEGNCADMAWPSKLTPPHIDSLWIMVCYVTYGVGEEPEDTAELSLKMDGLDTTYNSVRVRCDITVANGAGCDSLRFYRSGGASIKVVAPSDPQDTSFSGLDAETEYDFWAIGYDNDSSLIAYSDTISITTEAAPVPDPLTSVALDSVYNDKVIEDDSVGVIWTTPDDIGDSVYFAYSVSGYPDSSTIHTKVVYVADVTDTTGILWTNSPTESYTLYVSAWVRSAESGWSTRKTDSIYFSNGEQAATKRMRFRK